MSTSKARYMANLRPDTAPATLNTLNELAAAIGDDDDYAAAVTSALSGKLATAGGAMTGAITTNSTFDGIDIATRDGVLTSTTTTANAALPKAGGTMTGNIVMGDDTSIGIGDAVERIEFDGAGDISVLGASLGIGTDAPTYALTIADATTFSTAQLMFQTKPSETDSRAWGFATDAANYGDFAIKSSNANDNVLDTTPFLINKDGEVGIGLTDPDSRLEVYGPVQTALHVKGNDNDALYIDTVGNSPYIINARLKNGGTGFQVESTGSSTGLINWVGGALHNNSDRTLKKDITDLGSCLDKVKNLRGVTFKWKAANDPYRNETENSRYQMDNIGFIAQELEEEFPAVIDTNDISGLKSIRNNNLQLTAIVVEAIKELADKLDIANTKIEALENA